jgi:hypothetical protein
LVKRPFLLCLLAREVADKDIDATEQQQQSEAEDQRHEAKAPGEQERQADVDDGRGQLGAQMHQGAERIQHLRDLLVDHVDEMTGVACGVVAVAHPAVVVEQSTLQLAQQSGAQDRVEAERTEGQYAFGHECEGDDEQHGQGRVGPAEAGQQVVQDLADAGCRSGRAGVEALKQRQQHQDPHRLGESRDHRECEYKVHPRAQIVLEDAQVMRNVADGVLGVRLGIRCCMTHLGLRIVS